MIQDRPGGRQAAASFGILLLRVFTGLFVSALAVSEISTFDGTGGARLLSYTGSGIMIFFGLMLALGNRSQLSSALLLCVTVSMILAERPVEYYAPAAAACLLTMILGPGMISFDSIREQRELDKRTARYFSHAHDEKIPEEPRKPEGFGGKLALILKSYFFNF